MNKQELLNLISKLGIQKEEFYVLSSGSLVLRDIMLDAGDLDIAVTKTGLQKLKEQYDLVQKENGWYMVSDNIECVCNENDFSSLKPEFVNGYYVQNINEYLDYLESSGREKDKKRIPLVKKYIEKKDALLNGADE